MLVGLCVGAVCLFFVGFVGFASREISAPNLISILLKIPVVDRPCLSTRPAVQEKKNRKKSQTLALSESLKTENLN